MKYTLLIIVALASSARSAEPAKKPAVDPHEAAEDKAWTVEGGASKGVQACHDDIENLCKSVKPGQGRLGACLKKNAKKLSKPCRDWLGHGGQTHVDRAFTEIDESKKAPPAKATR